MRTSDACLLLMTPWSLVLAAPALAQTPASLPQAEAGQQGVLVFTPDFFASQQPVTALDMVTRVPGFTVVDGDGARGFQGAVGNILINGARPASKNDTGSSVLSRTLVAQVERIELVRGGAPGIDMQGFSVVANVITREQSSSQTIFTGNAVLYDGGKDTWGGTWQFTARNGDRTWGFTLTDDFDVNDSNGIGPVVRRDGEGALLRQEDFFNDQTSGGNALRLNYASPFLGGQIDLTARYGISDYDSRNLQTSDTVRRESLYAENGYNGEFGAVYTRQFGERLTSETRFIHEFSQTTGASTSRSTLSNVASPEQRFESDGNASETIFRSLARLEQPPGLTWEFGGEAAYNVLETEQAFSVGGAPVLLPSASVKVEETRGEVFGRNTWRMHEDLSVESGLRVETSSISQSGDAEEEKTFTFIKPRLLATWTPGVRNQFRLRFEREIGQLDFNAFAASAELQNENVLGGNIDLEPEQRWISELAYERRFWGDGVLSLLLRHDEISNAIDVIPLEGGLSATGNIGDGTLDRLSVNIQAPLDRFGFGGGRITARNIWNRTEVEDPTTGKTRPISNVPKSHAVIVVAQDIKSWNLQWSAAWVPLLGRTSYDPDVQFSWRGRDFLEGWIEYKPTPTLAIRAQVNLWDDYGQTRIAYGDRSVRPISYIETRTIDPRTFYSLRLRQIF
ncbi:MAG: TonB-dependent receptor plug domain-containing protein [Brevundimonas sp.]